MSKVFGQQGFTKNGVINQGLNQGQMGQRTGFNQNFDSQSQIQDDVSDLGLRVDTLQQIDEGHISMGQLRMDSSLSALQQNYMANKTQNTQQGSSKGNINSSSYLPYENLTTEQIRRGDYSRGTSNQIRKNSNSNRNKYQANYNSQGRNDSKIKKSNLIHHNSSFYSQNSQEQCKQDKFGFVKAETIYGTGKCDGVLNSDVYISSLQTFIKEKTDKKKNGSSMNHTVMDRMSEYIEYTNDLQKRFLEQSMNSIDAAAHERFLKYENNEQSILNKLNKHILYTKERDHINQLTKAELMKNSFIPCKIEEEADLSVKPQKNQQKINPPNNPSANEPPPKSKYQQEKSPRDDLNGKVNSPKLIQVHKDSDNNIINKVVDKLKIQSSKNSSQKNSLHNSPRQPPSKLYQTPKQSSNRETASPTRRPIAKPENEEQEIYLDNIRSHRSQTIVEEKKSVAFLKQPTIKDTQQQEQIDEKQMLQKNRKVLKNKIEKIVSKHQKVIKDIDYAYQEVTEQIKKKELLNRMRSMSDANTPNNFSFTGNTPNQYLQAKEQLGGQSGKNHLQRLGKLVMNKINNTGFSQIANHSLINQSFQSSGAPIQRNSILLNSHNFNPNQIMTPISQGGQASAMQSLEFQKKQLLENIQNTQNENKIYFQAKYKIREKGLNFDLSNSNNKEQVLDRVLMNYFHQQDLLNEQENLLKKAYREKKSGRSVGRGKSYKNKELGSLLSKFEPKHMRLHLKDITKGISGGLNSSTMASMQQQGQRQQRSMTAAAGSRKQSYADKTGESTYAYKDFQDEDNVDFDVYKNKFEWKKNQNKIINYSKVCSPAEMVLQFMKQDPRYKKQQNIEAIDFLVQFDPKKAKEEEDMEGQEANSTENQEKNRKRFDDSIMRRCFFFYSNKNDASTSDRFQEVTLQKFLTLFYNLSGKEYDESIDQESQTPFPSQNNVFQEPEKNEISFFGHILKHKLNLNLKVEDNNKNRENKESKVIVLGDNTIEIQTLKTIFEKITNKKEKAVLNYYEFLEAIRKTSVQYYLKKISQDQIPQPQELFERFFDEFIKPQHMSFRDPEEQELLRLREHKQIDQLLKLFEDNLKDLFVFAGSMRSQTTYDFAQIYIGFQEMYEILQKLDFFPNKISKTTIRYIYFYTLSLDQGLDFQDFCQCLHLIGLRIIRFPLKNVPITQTPQEIYHLQRKCREIQYTIFKLKQEGILNQQIQKFIQDISLFYVHKDYIDYQKIQQKIIDIKESNQKQLQMM